MQLAAPKNSNRIPEYGLVRALRIEAYFRELLAEHGADEVLASFAEVFGCRSAGIDARPVGWIRDNRVLTEERLESAVTSADVTVMMSHCPGRSSPEGLTWCR